MAWFLKMVAKAVAKLPAGAARAVALHWGWALAKVMRLRRGYVLETGKIVLHAPASELLRNDAVKKAYLGG